MASNIETQARLQLLQMEEICMAVSSLSQLAYSNASPHPEDYIHLSYVMQFLTDHLQTRFSDHHKIISEQVLPLVADIKTGRSLS